MALLDRFRLRLPGEQWRRNRLAITVTAALVFSGFTFVMPFLPLYVKSLGVEGDANVASWSGLLISVSPLLAALLAPAWGRLADRFGMKIMVERAVLAMALHWALFGFAENPFHLLALRIVLGMFGGFGTLSMPLLVATTPKERISRSIGMLQTVQMISAAAGPMVGGLLADWIGIRATCLVSAAFALAALALIHALYREDSQPAPDSRATSGPRRGTLRESAALPWFGAMIALIFFVSFVERSFAPVVPLYLLVLGTGLEHAARTAGLIISLGLFSEAVSATIMGNRLRRIAPRRLLLGRLAGGALLLFPMGLVASASQLLVLRIALGLLSGGCLVVIYTLGSRVIPQETRATSFSFLSSAGLLGASMGPVCAGVLTHLHIRAIFFFNGLVYLGLLALTWKQMPSQQAALAAAEER